MSTNQNNQTITNNHKEIKMTNRQKKYYRETRRAHVADLYYNGELDEAINILLCVSEETSFLRSDETFDAEAVAELAEDVEIRLPLDKIQRIIDRECGRAEAYEDIFDGGANVLDENVIPMISGLFRCSKLEIYTDKVLCYGENGEEGNIEDFRNLFDEIVCLLEDIADVLKMIENQ